MRKIIASRNSEIVLVTPDSEVNKPVIIKVNAHIYGLDAVDPHLTLLSFLESLACAAQNRAVEPETAAPVP